MGGGSIDADAGVEVELVAAEALALLDQPLEQLAGVAATALAWLRGEVVYVEVVTPGEAVGCAEARNGGWC